MAANFLVSKTVAAACLDAACGEENAAANRCPMLYVQAKSLHVFGISCFSAANGVRPATLCLSANFGNIRGNSHNHVHYLLRDSVKLTKRHVVSIKLW